MVVIGWHQEKTRGAKGEPLSLLKVAGGRIIFLIWTHPDDFYPMIDIKKAGMEDWQKIRNIAFETWPVTYGTLMPMEQVHYLLETYFDKQTIQRQMNENGHVYLLAESEGIPVGFASYEFNYRGQPRMMIHKLYVSPAFQGNGIGTQVLDALTGIASQNHQTALRLKVYYLNRIAIRFYEKYGFVKTGIEKTDPGNRFIIEDEVMLRELLS